jgi:ferredoxin
MPYTYKEVEMPHVICEPCINVKDQACVEVCPVECIHPASGEPDFEKEPQLYIDPDECIDCGACAPVCPVEAIYPDDEVPAKWEDFIAKNADYYR